MRSNSTDPIDVRRFTHVTIPTHRPGMGGGGLGVVSVPLSCGAAGAGAASLGCAGAVVAGSASRNVFMLARSSFRLFIIVFIVSRFGDRAASTSRCAVFNPKTMLHEA